jgi:hypothetical protein
MNDDRIYDHKIPERVGTKKSLAFFAKNVYFRPFARYLFCFRDSFRYLRNKTNETKMVVSTLVPEVCTVNEEVLR